MAENAPDIDGMDDKAFDALKADMISGKDVSVTPTEDAPILEENPTEDDFPEPDDAPADGQPQKQENVPFGRYERERQRRREAENERETLRQRDADREQRLLQIMEAMTPRQQQEAPPPIPNEETDPLAFIGHLKGEVGKLSEQMQQRTQAEQQQGQLAAFRNNVASFVNQTSTADPEFGSAINHLVQTYRDEAEAYGLKPGSPQFQDHMAQTLDQVFNYALQNRLDTPNYIKGLAKARRWDGKAQQPAQQQAPDPAKVIANANGLAEIRKAGASLTPSGGSAAKTGMPSPQELLDMTQGQFDEWRAKNDLKAAFAA